MFSVDNALDLGKLLLARSRTASLDAQLLLAHVLGRERSWLFGHGDSSLDPAHERMYRKYLAQRQVGVPVAYLRGFVEWFGMDVLVTPRVLVPRPDTEVLVERALAKMRLFGLTDIVDVGTGSGAVALAIASHFPGARVIAIDSDMAALEVARTNVDRQGLGDRITIVHGSLLEPLKTPPDLILANLPYLSEPMMDQLDRDVSHEPRSALLAGPSGLELYAEMLESMRRRSWRVPVLFEIDPRQSGVAVELAAQTMQGAGIRVLKDYAGLDRIIELSL